MAPITPASAPLAGGSKNAIARCGAIRCPRMRCASVACWLGVATFSMGTEPIWQGSYSKQERAGILTAWSFPTPHYQLSNNHVSRGQASLVSRELVRRRSSLRMKVRQFCCHEMNRQCLFKELLKLVQRLAPLHYTT